MIGVFDSGLGGLSVLAAIARALPQADLIYLADTANVPYGNKSDDFIRDRVLAIGAHLIRQGCTTLVVACNTATAAAVQTLRQAHPGIAVVGIEPGVKPAAASTKTGRIAILATESTARSARLKQLIETHASRVQVHIEACPGWATRVETLHLSASDTGFASEIAAKITPLIDQGVDRIVLGCTHYTFIGNLIRPLLAGQNKTAGAIRLVEVADAVAREVARRANTAHQGQSLLILQSTAHPEHLQAALPALGLGFLLARLKQPASQVPV